MSSPMIIWVKIGTHPADMLRVVRKRRPPIAGDVFHVRERGPGSRPTRVRCDGVKDVGGAPLYMVSRW